MNWKGHLSVKKMTWLNMSNSFLLCGNFCHPRDPRFCWFGESIVHTQHLISLDDFHQKLFHVDCIGFLQRLGGMLECDIISPWHLSRQHRLQRRLQLPPEIKGSRARIYQTLPRIPSHYLWRLSDISQKFSCWQMSRRIPERCISCLRSQLRGHRLNLTPRSLS